MLEGADSLKERPVQLLSDAIELRGIMRGEAPCCTGRRKVLIEVLAQILPPCGRSTAL